MGPKRGGFSVWLCTIGSYGPYLHFELWQGAPAHPSKPRACGKGAREAQRPGRETGAFKHVEAMYYRESFRMLGMAMHH